MFHAPSHWLSPLLEHVSNDMSKKPKIIEVVVTRLHQNILEAGVDSMRKKAFACSHAKTINPVPKPSIWRRDVESSYFKGAQS